jgi:glucokinase
VWFYAACLELVFFAEDDVSAAGAVDVGGTKIAVGVVDNNGKVLARFDRPTKSFPSPVAAVEAVVQLLGEAQEQAGLEIQGIGIGCTGPVYPHKGTIGNVEFLPGWEGFNIVDCLKAKINLPTYLENDADAGALGEWRWGSGKQAHQFLYITVGTGIGVGIIQNGVIYRGIAGSHPEIGHHVIDLHGPVCFCGARGCWESMAGGRALEKLAQSHHPAGERIDAQQLCHLADKGDEFAERIVQQSARNLAIGVANLIMIFAPDVISFGGGLMQSFHIFKPMLDQVISRQCHLMPYSEIKIMRAQLGVNTGLIGAAQIFFG